MAEPSVTVEGADRLSSTLKRAAVEITDLEDAQRKTGDLIVGRARARAPKRSGRLAGSIRADTDKGSVSVGTDLVYGPPIHWGWPSRNIRAQPFLTTATEETQSQWVEEYRKDLQTVLSRVEGT